MKKLITCLVVIFLSAGIANSEVTLSEGDYRDLDNLHRKLSKMKRKVDQLMSDIVSTYPADSKNYRAEFGQDVNVDMAQTTKDIIVKVDLPGMEKDKIEVILEQNRLLRISGMREVEKTFQKEGVIKMERSSGRFERILELPCEGMSEGITATYKDGVLEILIPKREEAKEQGVRIKVQ
jgi:HSP20 family protein